MSVEKGYIYIRDNEWYKISNVYKVGITTSIKDRSNTYITGELYRGFYVKIYELNVNEKKLHLIDNLLKKTFKNYNVYVDGGKEFYNKNIINEIEPFFIENKIKFVSKTEDELKRINRKNKIYNNYKLLISKIINTSQIILRDYQITAIDYIIENLELHNKIYLSLATGAGKSQIAFNVISKLKPRNVLIFSPRTRIKEQNNNGEYLNYCYQSYKTVYDIIIKNNIKDLFIWFDEAHWALDSWIKDTSNTIKQFYMNDTKYIKYRLFTTASPNKEFVLDNKTIYGELYEPIKFKELKKKNYLADIYVEIFDREINKINIEFNNLIFNTFNKPNQERRMGISFHNNCNSAFKYYLHHLKAYKNGKIDIKPYLLINEDFIKKQKLNDEDLSDDLNDIKRIKKELDTDINYDSQINEFELEYDKKQKTIGYVVAKYSMGYDNKNIDIIYFTDYKLSSKDIIQSIGRGTRINGDKYLRIILPTNYNNDIGLEYKRIENVIKYLLLEIELEFDKIKSYVINYNDSNKRFNNDYQYEIIEDERDEKDKSNINTMKHDIIIKANQWTTTKITNQLKFNNIHNIEDYIKYKEINKHINLPDVNELFEFKNFNFRDTYINQDVCPYYFNKNECIRAIKRNEEYLIMNDIIDDNDILIYLNSVDNKIPKMSLWHFYGGKRIDYYDY